MTAPRRSRSALVPLRPRVAVAAFAAAAIIVAAVVALLGPWPQDDVRRPGVVAGPVPGTTAPQVGSPSVATPATTPGAPVDQSQFPRTDCRPAAPAGDGLLGIGVPRPARLASSPVERATFDAAAACLGSITGRPLALRTQFPIDVARRGGPDDDQLAELRAFGALLTAAPPGTVGIVSVRGPDFTRCGRGDVAPSVERAALPTGERLASCEYPSADLYGALFAELSGAMAAAAPGVELRYTAWNEPDHPMFTLVGGLGQDGAARQAGAYWTRAAAVVGPERVLAGEFADRSLPVLLRLRRAFVEGAGGATPPAWAIHPYRDLTLPAAQHVLAGFERAVAPAPVWLTEVTAQLSGRIGISGEPGAQRARGLTLRAQLERAPVRAVLYLLLPPPPPVDAGDGDWDSALADRVGRARPFICGLADLPPARCPGSADAYGG